MVILLCQTYNLNLGLGLSSKQGRYSFNQKYIFCIPDYISNTIKKVSQKIQQNTDSCNFFHGHKNCN